MQDFYNENEPIAVVTTEPFARFLDYLAPEGGCQIGSFCCYHLAKEGSWVLFGGLVRASTNVPNCAMLLA